MNEHTLFGPGSEIDNKNNIAKTAFGEQSVATFMVQAAWSFNYNINPLVVETTVSDGGVVSQEDSFAKIDSGVDPAGFAFVRTRRAVVYTPGIGVLSRFTAVFDTPQENSLQLIGIGNEFDGWFFGYNGTRFGVLKRRNAIDEWIYREDWSENLRPDFNPQKGNVYEIRFQWLGFGMQYFALENNDGNMEDVHHYEYANLNTQVSVFNPSLPLSAGVKNLGNTTNLTLKTPSAVGGAHGEACPSALTVPIGVDYDGDISAGENYLFSIRNPSTYVGKDNRLTINPALLTIATDGVKNVKFKVFFGSILTNPNFQDVEPGITPLQQDIDATAFTNGIGVMTFVLSKVDSVVVDLTKLDIKISSNTWFTMIAETTASSSVTIGVTFKSRV